MEAVAVKVVAEEALKVTLNVTLAPGVITVEEERPVNLKLAPATVARRIWTFAAPVFVRVIGCEFVWPKGTDAKFALGGEAESAPRTTSAFIGGPGRLAEGWLSAGVGAAPVAFREMDWGAAPAGGMMAARRMAQPMIRIGAPLWNAAENTAEKERLKNLLMAQSPGVFITRAA
jgi:hypothetical protein